MGPRAVGGRGVWEQVCGRRKELSTWVKSFAPPISGPLHFPQGVFLRVVLPGHFSFRTSPASGCTQTRGVPRKQSHGGFSAGGISGVHSFILIGGDTHQRKGVWALASDCGQLNAGHGQMRPLLEQLNCPVSMLGCHAATNNRNTQWRRGGVGQGDRNHVATAGEPRPKRNAGDERAHRLARQGRH